MTCVQAHKGLGIASGSQIQRSAEFVAPVPATFGQQGAFAVKAPHGIAATNANAVLWRQRRFVPLAVPSAGEFEFGVR